MITRTRINSGQLFSTIFVGNKISPSDRLALRSCRWLLSALCIASVSGCAVVAVADAAVTVVATGVKVTAKAVGAAADVMIPDGDEE